MFMRFALDDPKMQADMDKALGAHDWKKLADDNKQLGAAYRAALAKQGMSYSTAAAMPTTHPATQPGS